MKNHVDQTTVISKKQTIAEIKEYIKLNGIVDDIYYMMGTARICGRKTYDYIGTLLTDGITNYSRYSETNELMHKFDAYYEDVHVEILHNILIELKQRNKTVPNFDIIANFKTVYKELRNIHKKTTISNNMGFTSTSQINAPLNGKSGLSTKAIMLLVQNYNINPTFIFTGKGSIYL